MHIQFADLPVRDQERAKQFYVDHFGCDVVADAPMGNDGWRWIELRLVGATTTLHLIRQTGDQFDGPVLALVDDEVVATVEMLRSRAVEIVVEPQQPPWQPGRTVAEFRDSEGNRIMLGSQWP